MGLQSSKVDTYVLRVADDELVKASTGSARSLKKPSTPTSSDTILTKSSSSISPSRQRSLTAASLMEKQNSSPAITRQRSGSVKITPVGMLASKSHSGRFSAPTAAKGDQRCSVHTPWLLKNAKIIGAQVKDFELGNVIGTGLMGTVRIARTKDRKFLVLKSIRKEYIVRSNSQRHVQGEKEVLLQLNCSFCIKLFGSFQDKSHVHFALEYAPGGELFHRLGRKRYFPAEVAKFYISEIFVALEHVQSLGFVYRDLKPENITLDEEGHCKLVDFGFTTRSNTPDGKIHTLCGTPAYLSPEQLDGKLTNGYTKVVDWWSFGILLYELLTGTTPFCRNPRDSHYEIFLRILKNNISFPSSFDTLSKELVRSLCHSQLDKRLIEPIEIKQHPYFAIAWEDVARRKLVPPFVPRLKEEGDFHYFDSFAAPIDSGDGSSRYDFMDF